MREFAVWAPKPERVRLDVDGVAHPMTRTEGGWWRATVDAMSNSRYGFLLDDDPAVLPDPRSPRQPEGVHARSQLWEPAAAAWTDGDWAGRSVEGGVIYELHVGTFTPTGTFDAAIEKLDHLADLGVDFVEVMPVNSFSGTHGWGYDGVLWYAVHEPYGGPDGLVRFVDACHARGLGVLIDVVFNHLGRRATTCRGSGRTCRRQAIRGARASTSLTPALMRCAAISSTARCTGWSTFTPTACG
ncbi:alpha amylase, catalytic domain protein [Mycobacterium xenopi 4042]|uniref:Alpha amylase, catalytic domain protein n=1 Tax=Mycobacterium xenopi 4042 TaxID=1299334 RepID=X7YPX6_MYCXE|nr:alpha amylase, catalytic domain protein [Mycobacterium xenopi 4042]